MLRRAFTVALALLLCWSSFAHLEGFAPAEAAWGEAGGTLRAADTDRGSVAAHHLDDQPLQLLADAAGDLPGWLAAAPTLTLLAGPGTQPPPAACRACPGVAPDVPHRPPRA